MFIIVWCDFLSNLGVGRPIQVILPETYHRQRETDVKHASFIPSKPTKSTQRLRQVLHHHPKRWLCFSSVMLHMWWVGMVLGVGGTKLYHDTGLPLVQPAPFLGRIKKPPDICFGYTHPIPSFKTEHTNWGTRGRPTHPMSYCTEVHSNIIPSDLFTLKTTATHPLLCARCFTPISVKLGDTMVLRYC